jgi:hypothetical protein
LNAGAWFLLGLLGMVDAPPWPVALEQYHHLQGCPISPGHFYEKSYTGEVAILGAGASDAV